MPKYEYFCETNGQTVEVSHSMSDSLNNWGELCQRANVEPGDTPQDVLVKRIISGGIFISPKKSEPAPMPVSNSHSCGSGGCGCRLPG